MATVIVAVVLVVVLALIARDVIKKHRSGGCAGCPGGCAHCSCGDSKTNKH